jgi:hypothetical protein
LNRLEYIKRLITHEVELAADEVIQRRSGALIGNNGDRHNLRRRLGKVLGADLNCSESELVSPGSSRNALTL